MAQKNQIVESNGYGYYKWGVRREGSIKTTRYSKTKNESIDYARALAIKHFSTVTIHDLKNRVIRIEDYSTSPRTITIPKY